MEIRNLPVKLTDEELKVRGDQLAQKVKDKKSLEDNKRIIAADYKSKIDEIEAQVQELSTVVKQQCEYRAVECEWRKNFRANSMECFRTDTGELTDHRAMNENERQVELLPVEGGEKKRRGKAQEEVGTAKEG